MSSELTACGEAIADAGAGGGCGSTGNAATGPPDPPPDATPTAIAAPSRAAATTPTRTCLQRADTPRAGGDAVRGGESIGTSRIGSAGAAVSKAVASASP